MNYDDSLYEDVLGQEETDEEDLYQDLPLDDDETTRARIRFEQIRRESVFWRRREYEGNLGD